MKQLYVMLPDEGSRRGATVMRGKEAALVSILRCVPFNQVRVRSCPPMFVPGLTLRLPQALVFSNNRGWIEALAERLTSLGFPAAFTCGAPCLLLWRRCTRSAHPGPHP